MVDANMPCEWRFGMGWKTRDLQAVACSEWGLGSDNSQYRPGTLQKSEEYGEKSKSIIHKHFIIDVGLNIPSNLQCLIHTMKYIHLKWRGS